MTCTILAAEALSRDLESMTSLFRHLTKPGSDFNRKLHRWMTVTPALPQDGHIAIVRDDDEIVGWARTEYWSAGSDGAGGDVSYDTLEAFVHPERRGCSVASFAACGLVSSVLHSNGGTVAVFHPHMLLVARRAGLWPTLFAKENDQWVRV